jgi:hypothetical protein
LFTAIFQFFFRVVLALIVKDSVGFVAPLHVSDDLLLDYRFLQQALLLLELGLESSSLALGLADAILVLCFEDGKLADLFLREKFNTLIPSILRYSCTRCFFISS